jgi:hypothetical protein
MVNDDHVGKLVQHIRTSLPSEWVAWPGGWRGQVEAALIDAVLSIRAAYGSERTGVRAGVRRWQTHRDSDSVDDLAELAAIDPGELAVVLNNRQKLSGGARKADGIVQAAHALHAAGVRYATDLDPTSPAHRAAYIGVRGLGPVTWRYFCMLLGAEGVKADTWILRFVEQVLGRRTAADADALVTAAAVQLGVSATSLDHAIWQHMRS